MNFHCWFGPAVSCQYWTAAPLAGPPLVTSIAMFMAYDGWILYVLLPSFVITQRWLSDPVDCQICSFVPFDTPQPVPSRREPVAFSGVMVYVPFAMGPVVN